MSSIPGTSTTPASGTAIEYRTHHITAFANLLDKKLDMEPEHRDEWASQLEEGCYIEAFGCDASTGLIRDLDHSIRDKIVRKMITISGWPK